ncbi:MAG TPA: hypothetical protein PLB53_06260, partial [Candidatus Atribacteria bacterium]|nr:hypothetical protein [Candidatus Atribacteria bacterium]
MKTKNKNRRGDIMKPFNVVIDFSTGELSPGKKTVRRVSDVKNMFLDREKAEEMIKNGDPLVYE